MSQLTLQQKTFLLLLSIVTIAFGWILLPYAGAIFWGVILAIVFAPVYRWVLLKTRGRATLSSILVLLLILVIVILPLSLISGALVNQVASVVEMVSAGDITVAGFFGKVMDVLPAWAINLLDRFNLDQPGQPARQADGRRLASEPGRRRESHQYRPVHV